MSKQMFAMYCLLACALVVVPAAHATTLSVCPTCTYTTIQSAVDAANPGDTVSVRSGVYDENVMVSTPNLTLKGQKPTGSVLLDCPSTGTGIGIYIVSTGVTVKGFEIERCEFGIVSTMSPSDFAPNVVKAQAKLNSGFGAATHARARAAHPAAWPDQNTVISDNTFEENFIGVFLFETADCIVSGNDFFSTEDFAVLLEETFTDLVSGNTTEGSSIGGPNGGDVGIGTIYGDQETIKGNTTQLSGQVGIGMEATVGTTVSGNKSSHNGLGLWAIGTELGDPQSEGNTFSKNHSDANAFWDCQDDTVGSGTSGTANTWKSNKGDTSQPPKLCKQ